VEKRKGDQPDCLSCLLGPVVTFVLSESTCEAVEVIVNLWEQSQLESRIRSCKVKG